MATIAFLLEHEEGHLLPTFHLARCLAARGHRVVYLGLADGADFVRGQGLEYVTILEDVIPRGTVGTLWSRNREGAEGAAEDAPPETSWLALYERYVGAVVRGALDEVMRTLRPDLFLASLFHGANTLAVHYRYGRPIVLLTPFLRTRPRADFAQAIANTLSDLRGGVDEMMQLVRRTVPGARRLSDITAPFLRLRELILCPADLEIPGEEAREPDVHYTEPSVDLERREEGDFPWEWLDPGRRLLFASFGSQAQVYGRERALRLVAAAAGAMAGLPGWQLVLSAGGLRSEELPPLPANALVVSWAPQLTLLRRAAVAVTLGGLGTTKECILHGVPMVVLPAVNDQPDNARRIAHHRLGLSGDFEAVTPDTLTALVREVDGDPSFRSSVEAMRQRFLAAEESGPAVRRIEEALAWRRSRS